MFIDRIITKGFVIAALGVVFATIVYLLVTAYFENSSAPQVVRLVSLVPSPGNVILDDVGDSATLTVRGYYSDLTTEDLDKDFITYESTDPSVVSVSPDGVVTANDSGGADIIIRFGGFSKRVHALVFGDLPTLPPIDPDMVGTIPELGDDVRVVLNRVIVEMQSGYDIGDARNIASDLGGEVIFSYHTFPGHVIEFDTQAHALLDVLTDLEADVRIDSTYPDTLFEPLDHPIDTLRSSGLAYAYLNAGFEGAWRMMEKTYDLQPVTIWIMEIGHLDVEDEDEPAIIRREFDAGRIHIPQRLISLGLSTARHAAAVTGVIAARNHEGEGPHPQENFSGVVSSVPEPAIRHHFTKPSSTMANTSWRSVGV